MRLILPLALILGTTLTAGAQTPDWLSPLIYAQSGSCETNNLAFNAGRFSKIDLKKTRDDLNLYLQIILFVEESGEVRLRTIEQGLVGCKETAQGQVCSYKPYNDTKKLYQSSWSLLNDELVIDGLGSIKVTRPDYPWAGFELTIGEGFPYAESVGAKVIGGKVQVNFNKDDKNVARLCQ